MTAAVSVVIPAFNGRHHLEANLPPLLDATKRASGAEVIVVDDGSSDGTPEFVASRFPGVGVIALGRNRGFACACNAGVDAAGGEVVYLLNSDARVLPGFLEPVLERFGEPAMFAVGSREIPTEKEGTLAVPIPFFRFGLFGHRYVETAIGARPLPVWFVSAGHAAFSREKFRALGGFDELYRPFYWEDIDLCFRAWRRGWKVVLEPASAVHHEGKGTIGRFFAPGTIRRVYWKNRFLFAWKNLRDRALIAHHLACLPFLLAGLPLVRGSAVLGGFGQALGQLPEALRRRRREPGDTALSDRQILELFVSRP